MKILVVAPSFEDPFVLQLAARCALTGSTVLASEQPPMQPPPCMWHRIEGTGQGLALALNEVDRVVTWPQLSEPLLAAAIDQPLQGVVLGGPDAKVTMSPGWSTLALGVPWGPGEPLRDVWEERLQGGKRIWMADPGECSVISMDDAWKAVEKAWSEPGKHHEALGRRTRLPALLERLAKTRVPNTTRAPFGWAMSRLGVDGARIRTWFDS